MLTRVPYGTLVPVHASFDRQQFVNGVLRICCANSLLRPGAKTIRLR